MGFADGWAYKAAITVLKKCRVKKAGVQTCAHMTWHKNIQIKFSLDQKYAVVGTETPIASPGVGSVVDPSWPNMTPVPDVFPAAAKLLLLTEAPESGS